MVARLPIRNLAQHTPYGKTSVQHSLDQIPDAKRRKSKPIGFELS